MLAFSTRVFTIRVCNSSYIIGSALRALPVLKIYNIRNVLCRLSVLTVNIEMQLSVTSCKAGSTIESKVVIRKKLTSHSQM